MCRVVLSAQKMLFASCLATAMAVPVTAIADLSARPPSVETEEVPLGLAITAGRLAQYQSIRGATFAGWDPAGKGILVGTRFGNTRQLHRVYVPGGRREQITFFDEPVRGQFIPDASDGAVLITMSRGGNENSQVYLLDTHKHQQVLLTDGSSRNAIGAMLHDGSKMIISSNSRNTRDTDLYLADPRRANSMELIFPTDKQYWYAADWSRDGRTLLLGRYVSINESYLALLDLATGRRTDLKLPAEGPAAIADMALAPDGKSLYLATDARGEFRQLARLDLESGQYEWLSDDIDWDVEELEVEPRQAAVAFTLNDDGASRLLLLQAGQRREINVPLGIISALEFSPDGSQLGFSLARPHAPSDAFSVNLSNGKLTRWTYSEVGGLDPRSFVEPQRIRYRTFDGRMIPAYYYRPTRAAKSHKSPVLIHIHGGPESQYRPYFSSSIQYYVNQMGLAVLAPNVRGSRGYGKTYLKLDNAELREDSVKDIGALLDWIEQQEELDASRIAVSGASYGGYMVLASAARYGERIQAAMDVVGIANFVTFLENTALYRRDLRRAEYGDERDSRMRSVFQRINPTANADKIRCALLVAHGKNDPRVPFSEAQQIAEKVRAQGRPVWTVYANNEGHGFRKRDNLDYLRKVQVNFLQRYLRANGSP